MVRRLTTHPPGKIRIIGGHWRGRKIPVVSLPSLRPTSSRLREMLFNWLAPVIHDASCLDCCAGSGALGLEALSRGASYLRMLELDGQVARQLQKNLELLGVIGSEVLQVESLKYLAGGADRQFDAVFLDPPFGFGMAQDFVGLLESRGWLAPDSWIYLEIEATLPEVVTPISWEKWRERITGQVACRLYHRIDSSSTLAPRSSQI